MNSPNFPHVRSMIYSQPWAIEKEWLGSICEIFEAHIAKLNTDARAQFPAQHEIEQEPPYENMEGIAVIAIEGPLFPKANLMQKLSGASSYSQIGSNILAAVEDPDVNEIMIHANSPGGSTQGMFELASKILALREQKEITTFVEGACCSAMYCLASQTMHIAATEGSRVGSIGVIGAIQNNDRAMKNQGVDITYFRSSELKGIGEGPISPGQEAELMRMVRTQSDMFKKTVLRNRQAETGDYLSAFDPARVLIGQEAQDAGLVDSITTFEDFLSHRQSKY